MTGIRIAPLVLLIMLSISIPVAFADRCILPVTDADVYGPAQKAIIAWNGQVEYLILSTDLYASSDAKVLEILPLPSNPEVQAGSFQSFQAVQDLMMKYMPRAVTSEYKAGLEVVFHEKIGAHDIMVVQATSVDELGKFISDYTRKMGVAQPRIREGTEQIISEYLVRGYNYWVFDLVDLYSTASSVEPVTYKFQSPSLYYPLRVSATAKGTTEIILYIITSDQIDESVIPQKMRLARYIPTDQPIQFQVTHDELALIDEEVVSLFGQVPVIYPPLPAAWFTVIKYEGDLNDLDFDLEIPQRPIPCRSIEVSTDKTQYNLGELVEITIDFTHLLPECTEIMVVHSHQIRLQVLDSSGETVQSWHWQTDSGLHKTVTWRVENADYYTVKASSWLNGQDIEIEDQSAITVTTPPPPQDVLPHNFGIQWLLYGVVIAIVCILIGATITYTLLRPRLMKTDICE